MRTFVALEISPAIRQSISALLASLTRQVPDEAVRWVQPDNVHLTLAFLGEIEADRVSLVAEAVQRIGEQTRPLGFSVGGLGAFPRMSQPRVVWVGIEERSGDLAQLSRRVEEAFRGLGGEPPDQGFRPHLTIGRVRRTAHRSHVENLAGALKGVPGSSLGTMEVKEIVAFRSDLTPDGPVYARVAAAPFTGTA